MSIDINHNNEIEAGTKLQTSCSRILTLI